MICKTNQIKNMGKGDKKSRRGKIILGSYGIRRPRKKAYKAEIKVENVMDDKAQTNAMPEKEVKETKAVREKTAPKAPKVAREKKEETEHTDSKPKKEKKS